MRLGFNFQTISVLRDRVDSLKTTINFLDLTDLAKFWKQVEKLGEEFDWQFYLDYYEDLDHLSNAKEAFEHWIVFGQFEGRLPNQQVLAAQFKLKKLSLPENFDVEKYWLLNPDLQKKFANNKYREFKLIEHFLQHGQTEGRPYQTNFDWKFYLEYNDLNHLTTSEAAYEHWLTFGQQEGWFASEAELNCFLQQKQIDLPNGFDFNIYLNLNPDLQIRFSDHKYKQYKATEHFLKQGRLTKRHYSYDCLSKAGESQRSSRSTQQQIQQEAIELYSALFNPYYYLQQCSPIDKLNNSCLIHFIRKNVENYYLLNNELKYLAEAITLYRLVLQLQPNSAEVVARLSDIVKYNKQLYQHSYNNYPCDDDVYAQWLKENAPSTSDLWQMAEAVASFSYKPLISIILPVYNTPASYLHEALQSVLNQIYPYWELCIADDQSTQAHVHSILEKYAAQDSRIKLLFRSTNGHISACSNSALTLATGEFVTFLDHDDIITPDALYEVALLLNQHPEADMIYSDEDKLNEHGRLIEPYFKPSWCPDSFLTRMYTCHLSTYRRTLINQIGGFRLGYEGSQDYDLVLRLTELTNKIFHIPKILYHWRVHSASTASGATAKPYAYEAAIRSIRDALQRRGEAGRVIEHSQFPGRFTIRYEIRQAGLISIIISAQHLNHLECCLQSIFTKTTYSNYEVVIVAPSKSEPELFDTFSNWQNQYSMRLRFYFLESFSNLSFINNFAATQAKGEYLLFLSDSTEIITSDWLEAMVEQAQRLSIGAVGALLLYPDDSIQHAGIILGQGVANHGHRHFPKDAPGYFGQLVTVNNYSAVTGACLMCRRNVFDQVGGFDEQLSTDYNDVDLCLKILQQGYHNVHLPYVELYHYNSEKRGCDDSNDSKAAALLRQRWQKYIQSDPCYSPHLTREAEDYQIRINSNISIEILAVNYFESPLSDLIWNFSIDGIQPGAIYKNFLPFCGWILGKWSAVTAIEIVKDRQIFHSIPVNNFRPDIKQLYPDVPNAEYSGFMKLIGLIDMPSIAQLSLRAVLENEAQLPLGNLEIRLS